MRTTPATVAVLAAVLGAGAPAAQAANLIENGSFEKPVVTPGTYLRVFSGSTAIPHWRAMGSGDVAVVSGQFAQGCCTFPARKGHQFLDLTGGGSNAAAGVQQTVPTTPGGRYTLTFGLGNVVDPSGVFGTKSTVKVLLNGSPLSTDTATGGATVLFWTTFTIHLTAPTASTTIAFVNGDGPADNVDAIDTVKRSG